MTLSLFLLFGFHSAHSVVKVLRINHGTHGKRHGTRKNKKEQIRNESMLKQELPTATQQNGSISTIR